MINVIDRRARRQARSTTTFGDYRRRSAAAGQALTWLCGGALALNLLLVISILLLLAWNGLSYFWQTDLLELDLKDGRKILGEVWSQERSAAVTGARAAAAIDRVRLKIGNRDVNGLDFVWIDAKDIAGRSRPQDVVMLERLEWGNFYGTMAELKRGDQVLASGPQAVWSAFGPLHERKQREIDRISALEQGPIGDINYAIERLRLEEKKLD
ncbi:MAG TPA: hypothetical protein VLR69_05095, partial [Thermoanaerobaculia bacterium]|nr:hypothetical protein [Thermoanaerobaculia bacterium]